jgi:hypothetical protein
MRPLERRRRNGAPRLQHACSGAYPPARSFGCPRSQTCPGKIGRRHRAHNTPRPPPAAPKSDAAADAPSRTTEPRSASARGTGSGRSRTCASRSGPRTVADTDRTPAQDPGASCRNTGSPVFSPPTNTNAQPSALLRGGKCSGAGVRARSGVLNHPPRRGFAVRRVLRRSRVRVLGHPSSKSDVAPSSRRRPPDPCFADDGRKLV